MHRWRSGTDDPAGGGDEPMRLLRVVAFVTAAVMVALTALVAREWNVIAAVVFLGYGLPLAVLGAMEVAASAAARSPAEDRGERRTAALVDGR